MIYKSAPLVSIVIPVYNVEKYLRECLDSVINQTMREIQIICVNDGSTDSSLAILQEYAAKDARIEIIDKSNGGAASARNTAYPFIKGKYVNFIDSDDWIELDLCEKVYRKAEATGASITMFLYRRPNGYRSPIPRGSTDDKITGEDKVLSVSQPLWNKFFRFSFLLDHHLNFPEDMKVCEDLLFSWKVSILADRISVVPEYLYHYRITPDSLTHSWDKHWKQEFLGYQKTYEFLISTDHYAVCRTKFISEKTMSFRRMYFCISPLAQREMAAMLAEYLTDDDYEFLRSKQCRQSVRLFYQMILGTPAERLKARCLNGILSIGKSLECGVRDNVIRPIKKCLKAA